jgi:hypothetical protein
MADLPAHSPLTQSLQPFELVDSLIELTIDRRFITQDSVDRSLRERVGSHQPIRKEIDLARGKSKKAPKKCGALVFKS